MNEQEFNVLDELYFLQSFQELEQQLNMREEALKAVLESLLHKGWIKCLRSREGEEPASADEFSSHYSSYLYLATKAGLLAHNSI